MSASATATPSPDGEIVSFKVEIETSSAARKLAAMRRIPFSMWLREAAREKLKREKKNGAR